jgi:hypothetical protein
MIIFSFIFLILHLVAIIWVGLNVANTFKMTKVSILQTFKDNRWDMFNDILILTVLLISFFRVYF